MRFGILLGDVPAQLSPDEQIARNLRQVEVAQEVGFSYFFLGQHFLYGGGAVWPQPIPLLARIAAEVDGHVTLGTGVALAPLYHPVMLAEEIATLDAICRGRFVFGVGTGYRELEYAALGIPMRERVGRLEESLEIIRGLWRTEGEFSFAGKYWALESVPPHLRPVQQGGPPLWIGAKSRTAVKRAARIGDSWLVSSKVTFEEIETRWELYRSVREGLGLPLVPLPANRFIVPAATVAQAAARYESMTRQRHDTYLAQGRVMNDETQETRDARRMGLIGPPAEIIDHIRDFVRVVPLDPICVRVAWPTMTEAEILDYIRELGDEIVPALRDLDVAVPEP